MIWSTICFGPGVQTRVMCTATPLLTNDCQFGFRHWPPFLIHNSSYSLSAYRVRCALLPLGLGWIPGSLSPDAYVVRRTSIILYAVVRATRFPRARGDGGLEVCKRPWSFRGPRGHAPMGADGGVCRLLDVRQTLSLCSLYSDSPLSSWPQPRGSDGDVAPRKDTREDFGLSF